MLRSLALIPHLVGIYVRTRMEYRGAMLLAGQADAIDSGNGLGL